MKRKSNVLLMMLSAVLLVTVSVLGTMAYLTAKEDVVNTFTIGSVALTMDELDVDDSNNNSSTQDRDQANTYHLLPGHTYTKDPIIHVDASSESCWVFVKVENGISAFEAASEDNYTPIANQITSSNGWIALDGVSGVYWKEYTKGQEDKDLEVFEQFKISDNANSVEGWDKIAPETTKINVTGYAVQKDGFDTAKAAWDATFGAPTE